MPEMYLPKSNRSWLLCVLPLALAACNAQHGDPVRGQQLYARECSSCHSLTASTNAPMHCGLIGRKAGTVPGFAYSEAMRASKLRWDEKTLDEFLTAPYLILPGTIMGFPGFTEQADRSDVIAYLKQVDADPGKCEQK